MTDILISLLNIIFCIIILILINRNNRAGRRMSAYSKIKSFLEEWKKKKHYPYYYIIKYDSAKAQGYSYKVDVLLKALSREYKQNQDLNILKVELKIYGSKYYFNSWDDLLLAVEMNKIRGMESNNQ